MQTEKVLRHYAQEFEQFHQRMPQVIVKDSGMEVKNADRTASQTPWQRGENHFSWLDYWCAFAHCSVQVPDCSSTSHDTPKNIFDEVRIAQPEPKDIVGAHVQISSDGGVNWSNEKYIVPLCKGCNNQSGKEISIRDNTRMVEVIL